MTEITHRIQVTSFGGSGTTMFLKYLKKQNLELPRDHDWGVWKHLPCPPDRYQYTIPPGFRAIYLFADPVESLLSVFLRRIQALHAMRMQSQSLWPPALQLEHDPYRPIWGIDDFLKLGRDCFGMQAQFTNWTTSPCEDRGYPIMLLKYESLWERLDEVLDFVGLPNVNASSFPERRERNSKAHLEYARPALNDLYRELILAIRKLPEYKII